MLKYLSCVTKKYVRLLLINLPRRNTIRTFSAYGGASIQTRKDEKHPCIHPASIQKFQNVDVGTNTSKTRYQKQI